MMPVTARAHPNIALIKYWGKRDRSLNLPAVGSLSITLSDLYTDMRVAPDAALETDRLIVNGCDEPGLLPRISRCADSIAGTDRPRLSVESSNNFPVAAGLASSSSAFAAMVVATTAAIGATKARDELASLAGRASGSAARSLYSGFVELENTADDIAAQTIQAAEAWPLRVVIAITEPGPKPVSSGEAMELSRKTSPFYGRWVSDQAADLSAARQAVLDRDFEKLATVSEHNCLKMHSVMWASRPPVVYWNAATLECLQAIRGLQAEGIGVFFTIDAGPQVKAVCLPADEARVRDSLATTTGVVEVLSSGLGDGARLVEAA